MKTNDEIEAKKKELGTMTEGDEPERDEWEYRRGFLHGMQWILGEEPGEPEETIVPKTREKKLEELRSALAYAERYVHGFRAGETWRDIQEREDNLTTIRAEIAALEAEASP